MGKGKRYNRKGITLGLILFLGAALSPVWLNIGKSSRAAGPRSVGEGQDRGGLYPAQGRHEGRAYAASG